MEGENVIKKIGGRFVMSCLGTRPLKPEGDNKKKKTYKRCVCVCENL